MIGHLGELIARYGYLIVGLFIFSEGIAIPFPTDTTLVTAAAFAAHGRLSIGILFLISTAAASAGTTVAFLAGRRGGDFFERHSRKVNPVALVRTRRFFDRHGGSAILVGPVHSGRADAHLADGGPVHDEPRALHVLQCDRRNALVGHLLRGGLLLRPAPARVRARVGPRQRWWSLSRSR